MRAILAVPAVSLSIDINQRASKAYLVAVFTGAGTLVGTIFDVTNVLSTMSVVPSLVIVNVVDPVKGTV